MKSSVQSKSSVQGHFGAIIMTVDKYREYGGTEMIRTSDLAFRKRLPFVRYNIDNKQNIDHGLYLYHDNPKQPTHCNINRAISPKVQHYVACGGYAMPVWGASQ